MNMDVETTPTQSGRLSHWANTSIPETCRNEEHNTQGHHKSGNCVHMEIIISKAVWVTKWPFMMVVLQDTSLVSCACRRWLRECSVNGSAWRLGREDITIQRNQCVVNSCC